MPPAGRGATRRLWPFRPPVRTRTCGKQLSSKRSNPMNIRFNSRTALAVVLFGSAALSAAAVHLGCKEGALSDVRRQVVNLGGDLTGQQKGAQLLNAGADAWQKVNLNAEDEIVLGQNVAVSVTNSFTLTKDERLNKYVSLVGLSLVDVSPRPVGNWVFGVLESDEVNAFAGPNGYIFVTTAALER